MRLEITRIEGTRNDLLLRIGRAEIERALLSVANRVRLMALPGMPRHREATQEEARGVAAAKIPIEAHLEQLGVVGGDGRACRRAVAISNRNLGTNHGHVAWQRNEQPRLFRVLEDPTGLPAEAGRHEPGASSSGRDVRAFLTARDDGGIGIEDLEIDAAGDRLLDAARCDVSERIEWATAGQRVLRGGQVTPIDEIAAHFYDIRHVLAFDAHREAGERIRRQIYEGYPATFARNVRRAWRELGVPRARYVHNAVGVNAEALFVVQREGTIEEISEALVNAGAVDGVILDNGGSVACWVWWANDYAGGIVSPTVDYRPPGTSAIVFVLNGPLKVEMPGGSVSYSSY
jgi:hypothetical protein